MTDLNLLTDAEIALVAGGGNISLSNFNLTNTANVNQQATVTNNGAVSATITGAVTGNPTVAAAGAQATLWSSIQQANSISFTNSANG